MTFRNALCGLEHRGPRAMLPWHSPMAILEDSHQNFRLFAPLFRRYFDCCPEDKNSWAVKVNRLPLPHRPDCVIIGNVKYAFLCLDFRGRVRLVCVSSKPQKEPAPGLCKRIRLVGEENGPWPLPRADELGGRDQSGEEDRRREDTGEVRTENIPSEQY